MLAQCDIFSQNVIQGVKSLVENLKHSRKKVGDDTLNHEDIFDGIQEEEEDICDNDETIEECKQISENFIDIFESVPEEEDTYDMSDNNSIQKQQDGRLKRILTSPEIVNLTINDDSLHEKKGPEKNCEDHFTDINRIKVDCTFVCDFCSKVLTTRDNLKSHKSRKHGVSQTYQCCFCRNQFNHRFKLTSHFKKHESEQIYNKYHRSRRYQKGIINFYVSFVLEF